MSFSLSSLPVPLSTIPHESSYPFSHIYIPFVSITLYFLMFLTFAPSKQQVKQNKAKQQQQQQQQQQQPHSPNTPRKILKPLDYAIIIHNIILCIFSLATFLGTAPLAYHTFKTQTFDEALCHGMRNVWSQFSYWCWLFYISKIYEFLDTVIILVKGGRPGSLQVYHHMGAVIGMWLLLVTDNPASWIFIVFNSFIHTLMYAYYSYTAMGYKLNCVKPILTSLQISQFLIGCVVARKYYVLNDQCMTEAALFAITFNMGYVSILVLLFARFAYNTYIKPTKVAGKCE